MLQGNASDTYAQKLWPSTPDIPGKGWSQQCKIEWQKAVGAINS